MSDNMQWLVPLTIVFFQVMAASSTCFYAFIGFDVIATSGEEVRRPGQSIPVAIMLTLVICFLAYFGVSTVITLMVPWYELADTAALPKVFSQRHVHGAEYVIAVGGICALAASMMGSIYPLPRIIYALASDGLIFRFLGNVNSWTNTPFVGTWVSGVMAALLALFIDLDGLVQMMSIGTLMAYTLVAVSVLILRYQQEAVGLTADDMDEETRAESVRAEVTSHKGDIQLTEETGLLKACDKSDMKYTPNLDESLFKKTPEDSSANRETEVRQALLKHRVLEDKRTERKQEVLNPIAACVSKSRDVPPDSSYHRLGLNRLACLFNIGDENSQEPTEKSRQITSASIIALVFVWACLCLLAVFGSSYVESAEWWAVVLFALFGAALIVILTILARQPRNHTRLKFKVPFVPLIPVAAVMINMYLMVTLSRATWIRFAVWMTIGKT